MAQPPPPRPIATSGNYVQAYLHLVVSPRTRLAHGAYLGAVASGGRETRGAFALRTVSADQATNRHATVACGRKWG
jgi:hypothetical protein